MKKAYWNGEYTAVITCVLYEVTRSSNPNHWQNMFVGNIRQAVKINYSGQTWYIDNEHGDGYYKVTKGQGSPWCGHKSVDDPIIKEELPEDKWQTIYDTEALKKESLAHDEWMKVNDPENYEKIQSLKSTINRMHLNRNSQ